MPSHSATLIKPKLRLLPFPEHSKRCGPIGFERPVRSSSFSTVGVASKPLASSVHGPWWFAAAAGISVRM